MFNHVYQIFMGVKGFSTFQDIVSEEALRHYERMSVDVIWLTPFFKSSSYHGYDIVDYRETNPTYGSLEEFTTMTEILKQRGIAVMMDLVLCHTSSSHPWFLQSKAGDPVKKSYYHWQTTPLYSYKSQHTHDQSSHHAWHYEPSNGLYYWGPFSPTMPSLNLDDIALRCEITEIVHFWMKQGVSHIRLDAVKHSHLNKEDSLRFWKWFSSYVKKHYPDCYIIGECWDHEDVIDEYQRALGATFCFPLQGSIAHHLRWNHPKGVEETILWTKTFFHQVQNMGIMLDNHDMDRISSQLQLDEKAIKQAYHALFSCGMIPFTYYGSELGLAGIRKSHCDKPVRMSMDFKEAERQWQEPGSFFRTLCSLAKARKEARTKVLTRQV